MGFKEGCKGYNKPEGMKRKDFIRTGGRLLLLGGMIGATAYLVQQNKVSATCELSPTCEQCGKFSACQKPQAKEIKNGEEK